MARPRQNPSCGTGYAASEWRVGFSACLPGTGFGVRRTTLVNRLSGRCLDAADGAAAAPRQQAVLQQWDCISSGMESNWRNQDRQVRSVGPPVVHYPGHPSRRRSLLDQRALIRAS